MTQGIDAKDIIIALFIAAGGFYAFVTTKTEPSIGDVRNSMRRTAKYCGLIIGIGASIGGILGCAAWLGII